MAATGRMALPPPQWVTLRPAKSSFEKNNWHMPETKDVTALAHQQHKERCKTTP